MSLSTISVVTTTKAKTKPKTNIQKTKTHQTTKQSLVRQAAEYPPQQHSPGSRNTLIFALSTKESIGATFFNLHDNE